MSFKFPFLLSFPPHQSFLPLFLQSVQRVPLRSCIIILSKLDHIKGWDLSDASFRTLSSSPMLSVPLSWMPVPISSLRYAPFSGVWEMPVPTVPLSGLWGMPVPIPEGFQFLSPLLGSRVNSSHHISLFLQGLKNASSSPLSRDLSDAMQFPSPTDDAH